MHDQRATPGFGVKLRQPDYYEAVITTIRQHRRQVTLREVAARLNAKSLTTPTGLIWDRQKLASFIRNNKI